MRCKILFLLCGPILFLTGCKSVQNTTAKANKPSKHTTVFKKEAVACYYHDKFNGKKTASGEKFSNTKLTAAHKTLPFGTKVKVTNLANDKSVEVEINDRGPFTKGFEIDLSKKAFMQITDNKNKGKLRVLLEIRN